jgi:hypothetical protein
MGLDLVVTYDGDDLSGLDFVEYETDEGCVSLEYRLNMSDISQEISFMNSLGGESVLGLLSYFKWNGFNGEYFEIINNGESLTIEIEDDEDIVIENDELQVYQSEIQQALDALSTHPKDSYIAKMNYLSLLLLKKAMNSGSLICSFG